MPSNVRLITPPHIAENNNLKAENARLRQENAELRAVLAAAANGGEVPHVPTQRERVIAALPAGGATFTSPKDGSQVKLLTREDAERIARTTQQTIQAGGGTPAAAAPMRGRQVQPIRQTFQNPDGSSVQLVGTPVQAGTGAAARPAPRVLAPPRVLAGGAPLPADLAAEIMAGEQARLAAATPAAPAQNAAPAAPQRALPAGTIVMPAPVVTMVQQAPQNAPTVMINVPGRFPQAPADADPVDLIEIE